MITSKHVTLPAYYATALVNGDQSGLTTQGVADFNKLVADLKADGMTIVDVARDADGNAAEPRFTRYFRNYGGDADGGDVLDYVAYIIT